jgi:plasmid maintenance system killer protein
MDIKIAKWKDNAQAPVIFMIDDIANVLMKKSTTDELKIGEDWGYAARDKNSMWHFLSKNLLDKFPKIKTTFFLVTDVRVAMCSEENYTYTQSIDKDKKFMEFLRYLDAHSNVELSYHGTSHGKAGLKYDDFLQEWETFSSLEDAVTETNRGKELFKKVLGHYPSGGKYCGYMAGDFGDASISKTGFKWWSYNYDYLKWDKNDKNPAYTFDLSFNQGVVNIPTTVDASTLSLKITNKFFKRKYLKSLYLYFVRDKSIESHLESLYNNQEVISIYEHTSPYRTDKVIQYPNIVSDIDNLNYIFSTLSQKDVWYTTCDELADYFIDRERVELDVRGNKFQLKSNEVLNRKLTLVLSNLKEEYSLYDMDNNLLVKSIKKNEEYILSYVFHINETYQLLA